MINRSQIKIHICYNFGLKAIQLRSQTLIIVVKQGSFYICDIVLCFYSEVAF